MQNNLHKTIAFYENLCYNKNIGAFKYSLQEDSNMAEMKLHVEMLQGLLEDVKACVAAAKERKATYEQEISNVSGEQAVSKEEMKGIKQSFSLKSWIKSKFSGISADEARQVANSYGKYAEVVDRMADEERRMEDAKASLSTAESDLEYGEEVQDQVDRLMGMLGRLR